MKFLVLALALVGAASAIAPLGYAGLGYSGLGYSGLGYSGLGWGHAGVGYHGGAIAAPVVSAYHAPAVAAYSAPVIAPIVKSVVAAPAYGHVGLATGYNAGWGHGLGYAGPAWGIDAWKKKAAH